MGATTIYLRSPAKINLSLVVLGKREDGYHELVTEMVMIDLYDDMVLERAPCEGVYLQLSGRPIDGDPDKNLVSKGLSRFVEKVKEKGVSLSGGFAVNLTKRIPVGAGLGGGSSNAAIALWGANRLMDTPLSLDELQHIAKELGSDVPFFLGSPRAAGVGRGEILIPLDPPEPFFVLLWNPEIPLSTASVYKALDPADFEVKGVCELTEKDRSNRIGSLLKSDRMINSLESPAIDLCPQVGEGIKFLEGFRPGNVRMTGSGPTVFARFIDREEAVEISKKVTAALGGWSGVFKMLTEPPLPGV